MQLPEPEPDGTLRLTEKFSSDTSIWLILRRFESQAPIKRNFTARGVPALDNKSSGAGRLYYETPIVQAGGKELSSFMDLQKSPASIGVNSGSMLLRLRFQSTDRLLEEAITDISQYFEAADKNDSVNGTHQTDTWSESFGYPRDPVSADEGRDPSVPRPYPHPAVKSPILEEKQSPVSEFSATIDPRIALTSTVDEPEVTTGPGQRPISVLAPPLSSTPQAVQRTFDEAEFEPTPDQMRSHQNALAKEGRNRRLATDAELAAQAEAQRQQLATIKSVQIKVRFPDEIQVAATFTDKDTIATLYDHVRGLMQQPAEPFMLAFRTRSGPKVLRQGSHECLIGDLGMTGRMLVTFSWEQSANADTRMSPTLKEEYRLKAQPMQVQQPEHAVSEDVLRSTPNDIAESAKGKRREGVPKWLKLPGKK